jgi:mRNA interferase MazF
MFVSMTSERSSQEIRRGQVYFICLDPAFGKELSGWKMRPVLVFSVNVLNRNTHMVTVIPGTSEKRKHRSLSQNQVPINRSNVTVYDNSHFGLDENNNEITTIFECHQIRAVSEERFTQRPIGRLSEEAMVRIEDALRYCLGIAPEPPDPPQLVKK